MLTDCNGREIRIGDKVRHIEGSIPWEKGQNESRAVHQARLDAHPKNSDGFDGPRTVDAFVSSTCVRVGGGLDGKKSPVHLGCFLEVMSDA